MQQIQMSAHTGYPMFFKVKDKMIKPHESDPNFFHAERNVGVAVLDPIKEGDVILFNRQEHTVLEVSETRPCKGNHAVEGVIFQQLRTSFIDKKAGI